MTDFTNTPYDNGPRYTQLPVDRVWGYCEIVFFAGAATACFADKEYGLFPRHSLRWFFIIFGTLVMVGACAWWQRVWEALH